MTNSITEYPLGSEKRPLRVAVVGAGPSGFYAVDALLRRKDVLIEVDTFDRLPVPYGLVRFGVAPDHQNIKAIIKGYEKIATNPRFRFFGNIQFGRDINLENLQAHYDQIIFAVGAETDRKLNIPGEMLSGSYTATEFVAWYNGHPDYVDAQFDLSHERAVVVGGEPQLMGQHLQFLGPQQVEQVLLADVEVGVAGAEGVGERAQPQHVHAFEFEVELDQARLVCRA